VGKVGDKPIIGILGGIGSGKSTVAAEFAKLGCKVIDADKIAHELLDEPAVKEKCIASFGRAILDSDDKIDREKLAEVVFADDEKLASLLDMPLLVEVGWDKRCDRLIFVNCEQKLRLNRAKKLGFQKKQVKIRENFQISLDNKADLADNTIENNSDFSALARQVVNIFSYIMYNG